MHKAPKLGPLGKGFVQEIKTKEGTRYVARWNAYVLVNGERRRIQCGPHELGPKVHHGPGLKSKKEAQKAWNKIYWSVFTEHHPTPVAAKLQSDGTAASADMKVEEFIKHVWEPRRVKDLEDNSRINWEYYRDSFLIPFFGQRTLAEINNEDVINSFMSEVADRQFSEWTAKKSFTYVKALLDMARDLGITQGNAARLIPRLKRIPRGVKKSKDQPFVSVEQFIAILNEIKKPRDRMILKILFLCAVRRSELFVIKWKDFHQQDGTFTFNIERSFCSRTHKIKEWMGKQAGIRGRAAGKVAVPPRLAKEIIGWREYGDTDGSDPESFIFPTRNGTCMIPTNWAEDVLKPAGERAGVTNVSYHWFRRGHATVQHHVGRVPDKQIQGQLRHSKVETTRNIYMQQVEPETWKAVVDLERIVYGKKGGGSKGNADAA